MLILHIVLCSLFLLWVLLIVLHQLHDTYGISQLRLMNFDAHRMAREVTYYRRRCDERDITATDATQLTLDYNATPKEALQHNARHGVSIFPQVIQEDTAAALRDYILSQQNKTQDHIYVISPTRRFSGNLLFTQHDSIVQAVQQVATHSVLRPALEAIVGDDNPAVIELSYIVSLFGAKAQMWHADTDEDASAMKYARSFAPSYSLFIPLQDTTGAMGATELCPGSHVCHFNFPYCTTTRGSLRMSDRKETEQRIWPRGYGALLNQQLQHRGTAHTDEGGEARVMVVMTFAPRPRWAPGQLETRMVSLGSTFSIHWSHLGHTMNDYAQAPTTLRQPWRTLRALGIYKPEERDWGWDFISLNSMRLVNHALGFYDEQLRSYVAEGGIPFIPQCLQGRVSSDDESENIWYDYLLDTLIRCRAHLKKLNVMALGSVLVLGSLIDQRWLDRKRPQKRNLLVWTCARRLLLSHGLILLTAQGWFFWLSTTSWAKNIRTEKLYDTGMVPLDGDVEVGTLPYRPDVLVETRYNSRYLGAYRYMIDLTHPGNIDFRDTLRQYSEGYVGLTRSLQRQLISDILQWVRQKGGRLLSQNHEGNWYALTTDRAMQVCHKELLKTVNDLVDTVLSEIEHLQSETEYGLLRNTTLHRRHIPWLLKSLQDKIIDFPGRSTRPKPYKRVLQHLRTNVTSLLTSVEIEEQEQIGHPAQDGLLNLLHQLQIKLEQQGKAMSSSQPVAPFQEPIPSAIFAVHPFVKPPIMSTGEHNKARQARVPSLPPAPPTREPYLGAWLEVGDVAEAKYEGTYGKSKPRYLIHFVVNRCFVLGTYFELVLLHFVLQQSGILPRSCMPVPIRRPMWWSTRTVRWTSIWNACGFDRFLIMKFPNPSMSATQMVYIIPAFW